MEIDRCAGGARARSEWFDELSIAIEQAQRLAWRLGVTEGQNSEALALYFRLDAVRDELQALRRGAWVGEQRDLDPFWVKLLPSAGPLLDTGHTADDQRID